MSEFVEVKTSQLGGVALDWMTLLADGWVQRRPIEERQLDLARPGGTSVCIVCTYGEAIVNRTLPLWVSPSTQWKDGGPLIEKYKVMITYHNGLDRTPLATTGATHPAFESGGTVLIAACRAIVASALGDTVQVPKELLA